MTSHSSLRAQFTSHIAWDGRCWVWTAYCNQDGHGRIAVKRRLMQATHVAWFLRYGVWPKLQLNHTCDKPACITIKHLYEGTQKQNLADMRSRGRAPSQGKFFKVDGVSYNIGELAKLAGVTRTCIHYRIKRGLTGRDLIARYFEAPRGSR